MRAAEGSQRQRKAAESTGKQQKSFQKAAEDGREPERNSKSEHGRFFSVNRFFGTFGLISYLQSKERTTIGYVINRRRNKEPHPHERLTVQQKLYMREDTGENWHSLRLRDLK